MRALTLLVVLVALVAAAAVVDAKKYDLHKNPRELFDEWLADNGMAGLSDAEKRTKYSNFVVNLKQMKDHNGQGHEDEWNLGPHAAMTDDEFFSTRMGAKPPGGVHSKKREALDILDTLDISAVPSKIDWRAKGKVTSIKNQGKCGCCWAFATAASIESAWAIKGHSLANASPQHVLDCTPKSNGCNGGWVSEGIKYAIANGGLHTWGSYGYKGYKGTCRKFSTSITGKVSSQTSLPQKDYAKLKAWVGLKGPVAVLVDATYWKYYSSGILTKGSTDPMKANHAVVVVGYSATSTGVPYWIVKNSWGTGWGRNGYAYVKRSSTANFCGLTNWPMAPIV